MNAPARLSLNLGGEGEELDAINQQPEWVTTGGHWTAVGPKLALLVSAGSPFLFCRNAELPFPNGTVDFVVSNNVPVDVATWLGPGIQSSEVHRILRSGGQWLHDGTLVYVAP